MVTNQLLLLIKHLAHRTRRRDAHINQNGPRTMIPSKLYRAAKRDRNKKEKLKNQAKPSVGTSLQ